MIFNLTFSLCICAAWLQLVFCLHNVTIDDTDAAISYNPRTSWSLSANSSLNAGFAHMLTQDAVATATLNFTGIAVYFMSPLWPYIVNTAVALDSGPPVHLDLTDHSRPNVGEGQESIQSQVVWSAVGLSNAQHTLVVSVIPGQPFAIVDTIIYTALDVGDLTTTSSAVSTQTHVTPVMNTFTSSTSTSTSTQLESSSNPTTTRTTTAISRTTSSTAAATETQKPSPRVLPIALGSTLGVIALFLISLCLYLCRGRKRPASEMWSVPGASQSRLSTVLPDNMRNEGENLEHGSRPLNVTPAETGPEFNPSHLYSTTAPITEPSGVWQGTTAQIAQRYRSSRPDTMSMVSKP